MTALVEFLRGMSGWQKTILYAFTMLVVVAIFAPAQGEALVRWMGGLVTQIGTSFASWVTP